MTLLEEFNAKHPGVPTFNDDRCLCDGCRVAYIRDILAGGQADLCDCGCYA